MSFVEVSRSLTHQGVMAMLTAAVARAEQARVATRAQQTVEPDER